MNDQERLKQVLRHLSLWSLIITAVISSVTLIGWGFESTLLTSIKQAYIPIAPSTAFCFFILSASFLITILISGFLPRMITLFCASFTGLITLMLLIPFFTGTLIQAEHLGFAENRFIQYIPMYYSGHMSPLSSINFMVASSGILLLCFSPHGKQRVKNVASFLALIVSATGLIIILGYLHGTPLLYGGTIIPVAFPTAVAFVFLGLGILFASGPSVHPILFFTGSSVRSRLVRAFLPVAVGFVLISDIIHTIGLSSATNPALQSALLAMASAMVVGIIVTKIAKSIGREIDRANRERDEKVIALRESEAHYRAVTQSANDAIITTDSSGTIVDWNRGAEKIFGYTESEISGQPVIRLLPSRYRGRHLTGMSRVQAGEEPQVIGKTVELEGLRKDLSEFPIELSLADWKTGGGRFYTAILRDITERKLNQKYIEHLAIHDSLTGLLNRHSLEDILNRTIAKAKRGTMSSLLYMDLDNFKEVNDTVGHSAGDEVLIILTNIIKAELRTEDIVFRLGGDEFAVLLEGMSGRVALSAAERLRLIVEAHPFEPGGRVFPLSLSIGLIEIEGTLTTGELLSQADAAMYRAKAQGKNRIVQAR